MNKQILIRKLNDLNSTLQDETSPLKRWEILKARAKVLHKLDAKEGFVCPLK